MANTATMLDLVKERDKSLLRMGELAAAATYARKYHPGRIADKLDKDYQIAVAAYNERQATLEKRLRGE